MFGSLGMEKYLPKIELITSNGKGPRVWIKKCVKYFEIYKVPNEEKVGIASLLLVNRADARYYNWINDRGSHS